MGNLLAREQEQPENATMRWHQIFMFLMGTLVDFLQLMFQSKPVSPFETHYKTVFIFIMILHIYAVALATEIELLLHHPNSRYAGIVGNTRLLSGILASILILQIIIPAFGWFCFVIWLLYFFKVVFEWLSSERNLPLQCYLFGCSAPFVFGYTEVDFILKE